MAHRASETEPRAGPISKRLVSGVAYPSVLGRAPLRRRSFGDDERAGDPADYGMYYPPLAPPDGAPGRPAILADNLILVAGILPVGLVLFFLWKATASPLAAAAFFAVVAGSVVWFSRRTP